MKNLPCLKTAHMRVRTAGHFSVQNIRLLCVYYRFSLVYYASIMCVLRVYYELNLTPFKSFLRNLGKKKNPITTRVTGFRCCLSKRPELS